MTIQAIIQVTRPPLVTVAGLTLLTRNILAAATAGASTVTVVSRLTAAQLAPALAQVRRSRPDLELHTATTAEIQAPAAGKVLLLHTDGLVTPGLARALLRPTGGAVCRPAAGELPLCQPAPRSRLRISADSNRSELARQLDTLAGDLIPVSAAGYTAIATPGDSAGAERALFRGLTKTSDGLVSRYLNRPLSTRISRRLARYNITPMQLTALTAAFGLAMFGALISATPAGIVTGCLLFHATSVVDGLDGEIARAKFLSSRRGAAWDTGVDMATNLLFIVGLMISLITVHGSGLLYLGIYLVAVAFSAVVLMTVIVRLGPGGGSFDIVGQALMQRLATYPRARRVMAVLDKLARRDFYAFAFALMGVAGLAVYIPWVLAIGMSLWLVTIVVNIPYLLSAPAEDLLPDHIRVLRS
jgi:CDP-L-myo-inositol myo-inositolphosphotransferase